MSDGDARRISLEAKGNSGSAARAFKRAIDLREALYLIFLRIVAGQSPPRAALAELMRAHRDGLAHGAFVRSGNRFQWVLPAIAEFVRWRIAQDAIALLESAELLSEDVVSWLRSHRAMNSFKVVAGSPTDVDDV